MTINLCGQSSTQDAAALQEQVQRLTLERDAERADRQQLEVRLFEVKKGMCVCVCV